MRESVKFRMWNSCGDRSRMFYDDRNVMTCMSQQMAFDSGSGYFVEQFNHEGDGNVFMQYTGRKDKDDRPVYEGDIVEFDAKEWGSDNNVFAVEWDNENSCWSFGGGTASDMGFRKVIGNIYENPELLNKEDK